MIMILGTMMEHSVLSHVFYKSRKNDAECKSVLFSLNYQSAPTFLFLH